MTSLDEHARAQPTLRELDLAGRVRVDDLARRCGVSTVTVRKDLQELEHRSALRRVRDGDVIALDSSTTCHHLTGATVRRSSRALVGAVDDVLAGRGRTTRGFVGAHALSPHRGTLDLSSEEAQAKRYLMATCRAVHGLVDPSKLDAFSLHTSVPSSALTAVWTDDGADPAAVAALRDAGVPVRLVEAGTGP